MTVSVDIRAVKKVYPSQAGRVHAFGPVDLAIGSGRFVSLVGPSGCGKSTLLLMMAGLLDITEGEITVAGRRVAGAIRMPFRSDLIFPLFMPIYAAPNPIKACPTERQEARPLSATVVSIKRNEQHRSC